MADKEKKNKNNNKKVLHDTNQTSNVQIVENQDTWISQQEKVT